MISWLTLKTRTSNNFSPNFPGTLNMMSRASNVAKMLKCKVQQRIWLQNLSKKTPALGSCHGSVQITFLRIQSIPCAACVMYKIWANKQTKTWLLSSTFLTVCDIHTRSGYQVWHSSLKLAGGYQHTNCYHCIREKGSTKDYATHYRTSLFM